MKWEEASGGPGRSAGRQATRALLCGVDRAAYADELSDEEAAQAFFDALADGDRDATFAAASPEAVAFFEPWEPMEGLSFSGVQDGVFFINPEAAPFQCSVFAGVVERCLEEPTSR